ncbi:MAG TPA: thiopurine S-methyltransferase [Rhodanobacteraceae bacterium]
MQTEFWLQRWRDGRTGFHHDRPFPLLLKHWPALALSPGAKVLVPLCGKSLDMPWLAAQGHRVLGVELSPIAIAQFLRENRLEAHEHDSPLGHHYVAGAIEIIQGDVFGLDDETLASVDAVYDRAAIIALPPAMRDHYARKVYGRLRPGCRGLMITLEYPQADMDGPPFSVDATIMKSLLGRRFAIEQLERRDILADQPSFADAGVNALHTSVYALRRDAD